MSLFKILDEYQIAAVLDHTIAVRVFDEAKMMMVYVVSNRFWQVIPFEDLHKYGNCKGVVCIELTSNGISFSGTDEYCTEELTNYVTTELSPYGRKVYHQDLAFEAVKEVVNGDTARLYALADSLTKNVGLTEKDGYYDTIGERAFFALVEMEELDANVACTIGY